MGHKIHPRSVRLGYIQDWRSKWFSAKDMPTLIKEDVEIRRLINDRFNNAAISWIGIERAGSYLRVNIHTARPGVVIGKKGVDIEAITNSIEKLTGRKTHVNVMEIKEPDLDASLVAESISFQIERRINPRRAMRRAMDRVMQAGALGVKVRVAGRLNGAEIARREEQRRGRVPLHTFSADIDYALSEARTTAGAIGVKVWVFKKLHFKKSTRELLKEAKEVAPQAEAAPAAAPAAGAQAAPAAAPAAAPEAAPAAAPAAQPQAAAAPAPAEAKPAEAPAPEVQGEPAPAPAPAPEPAGEAAAPPDRKEEGKE